MGLLWLLHQCEKLVIVFSFTYLDINKHWNRVSGPHSDILYSCFQLFAFFEIFFVHLTAA
jgi:hypothetical protein